MKLTFSRILPEEVTLPDFIEWDGKKECAHIITEGRGINPISCIQYSHFGKKGIYLITIMTVVRGLPDEKGYRVNLSYSRDIPDEENGTKHLWHRYVTIKDEYTFLDELDGVVEKAIEYDNE